MNFNQGDQVVHQAFGLGVVVSIESLNLNRTEPRLFYRIAFTKTTIFVPLDDPSKSGLRPITPKSHLARYRTLLKNSPFKLDSDYRKRHSDLEKRRSRGTFQDLCEVVRDLNALDAKKPLSYTEKTLFNQTREALVLEWSAISGISFTEAMSEIDGCLYSKA